MVLYSVFYLVIGAHAAPVGQRAVLLLLLSELALDDKRLVGRLFFLGERTRGEGERFDRNGKM
jgi:hypothetical protein